MQLFSQRDPRWAKHPLGWGPALGTIGGYGCFATCLSMIAWDAFPELKAQAYTPDKLDELLTTRKLFARDPSGTFDLLTDNALDRLWPTRFATLSYAGYRPDVIGTAVRSPDTYAVLWISTAAVPTHFVIAYSADSRQIADPWTGRLGLLSGYGGPQAVHKVIAIRKLKPAPAVVAPTPAVGAPLPIPSPVPATVIAPVPGGPPMTFTAFDKAILAAVMGPLIVLATSYVNGSQLGSNDLIAAAVAAVVAGLAVYFKGNQERT